MANPTLHWRMLAPVFVTNATAGGFIEAIYQMGTATTYADGTARVPGTFAPANVGQVPLTAGPTSLGTGSAWTWNFDATTFGLGQKVALYAYAPTSTAINQQIIVAGLNSNPGGLAWKQLLADARGASFIYAGIGKGTGLYTSLNNATTPFTVGDFTGLGLTTAGASLYSIVYMWECEEAVAIQFFNTATGNVSGFMAGAYIDPLSANTANAETDGRLYGITTTGSSSYTLATWLSSVAAGAGQFFYNSNAAGDQHSVTFTPGAGTLVVSNRFGNYAPSGTFTSRNGDLPQIPIPVWNLTQFMGQLRQIFITRDSITGTEWQVGATPKGYLFGASPSTAVDAVLLTY